MPPCLKTFFIGILIYFQFHQKDFAMFTYGQPADRKLTALKICKSLRSTNSTHNSPLGFLEPHIHTLMHFFSQHKACLGSVCNGDPSTDVARPIKKNVVRWQNTGLARRGPRFESHYVFDIFCLLIRSSSFFSYFARQWLWMPARRQTTTMHATLVVIS